MRSDGGPADHFRDKIFESWREHAVVRFIDPGIRGERKRVLGNATQLFPDRGSKARKSSANPFREIWGVAGLLSALIDQRPGLKFGKR